MVHETKENLSKILKQAELKALPDHVAQKLENYMKYQKKTIQDKHDVNRKLVQALREQAIKLDMYENIKQGLFDYVDKIRVMDLDELETQPAKQSLKNLETTLDSSSSIIELNSSSELILKQPLSVQQKRHQEGLNYTLPIKKNVHPHGVRKAAWVREYDSWKAIKPVVDSLRNDNA